jgi:hypothetical protein
VAPSWPQLGSDESREIEAAFCSVLREHEWPFMTVRALLCIPSCFLTLAQEADPLGQRSEQDADLRRLAGCDHVLSSTLAGPVARGSHSGTAPVAGGLTRSGTPTARPGTPLIVRPRTDIPGSRSLNDVTLAAAAAAAAAAGDGAISAPVSQPPPLPLPVGTSASAPAAAAGASRVQPEWGRFFASLAQGQAGGVLQSGPATAGPAAAAAAAAAASPLETVVGRDWFDEYLVAMRLEEPDSTAAIARGQAVERFRTVFTAAAASAARALVRFRAGTAAEGPGAAGGEKARTLMAVVARRLC